MDISCLFGFFFSLPPQNMVLICPVGINQVFHPTLFLFGVFVPLILPIPAYGAGRVLPLYTLSTPWATFPEPVPFFSSLVDPLSTANFLSLSWLPFSSAFLVDFFFLLYGHDCPCKWLRVFTFPVFSLTVPQLLVSPSSCDGKTSLYVFPLFFFLIVNLNLCGAGT